MVKALPAVLPMEPNTRLEVVAILIVPLVLAMGVLPVWKVNVLAPTANAPLVKLSVLVMVGEPVKLNPPALFSARLEMVAPEMVAALVLMVMMPAPVSVPVPVMLPATEMALPALSSVPAARLRLPAKVSP
jgi:hypothetical protein